MSEKHIQPPSDPGDISDDTKKELIGIEFKSVLDDLKTQRERIIDIEMMRHGLKPDSDDKETQIQKTKVIYSYLAAESDILLSYIDSRTGQAEHEEMFMFQNLDLLGEEIIDIRLDFNGQPGFVVEQVFKNEGEKTDQIRWTGYHLKNGKIYVVSLNIPIEELGHSDIDHQKYIHQRLLGLKTESKIGLNDTECPVILAQQVNKIVRELRSVLASFYNSVELNSEDIANW